MRETRREVHILLSSAPTTPGPSNANLCGRCGCRDNETLRDFVKALRERPDDARHLPLNLSEPSFDPWSVV